MRNNSSGKLGHTITETNETKFTNYLIDLIEKYGEKVYKHNNAYNIAVKCYHLGCNRAKVESFAQWLTWKDVSGLSGTEMPPVPANILATKLPEVIQAQLMLVELTKLVENDLKLLVDIWSSFSDEDKKELTSLTASGLISFASENVK